MTVPAGFLIAGAAEKAQASVPLTLIHSTIRIARGFVAANTIALLAQGVLNSMLLNQLRLATVVICLGLGASYSAWQALGAAENGKGHGQGQTQPSEKVPTVRLIRPAVRDIVRVVGQPTFIESYQRTPIFATVTGYVEKSFVDIGDKVKKGDVLARMIVPEPGGGLLGAQGRVKVDEERRELARKTLPAAEAAVRSAQERLASAAATQLGNQSDLDRWDAELKRLKQTLDRRVEPKSSGHSKSTVAAREAALKAVRKAESELLSYRATISKAKVEASVASAALAVAQSEVQRLEELAGDLALTAPYDGLIVARNANTFDFVQAPVGNPAAMNRDRAPQPPLPGPVPLFVVDRVDIVRVFIDVPEQDAGYVHVGTRASVTVKGYRDEPIPSSVTRVSWAINVKTRCLRVEIDLPNPDGKLKPGMYAYAKIIIDRPEVRAAVVRGDQERRQVVLLDLRERPGGADRDQDRDQRWPLDRGRTTRVGPRGPQPGMTLAGRPSTAPSR